MTQMFAVNEAHAAALTPTTMTAAGLTERAHVQEWILGNPAVLGEDVLVITCEYDRWVGSDGARTARRLDVLGLDRSGQLVVVELKRDDAGSDVHLQAITYAALVSRFDIETLAQAHAAYSTRRGTPLSEEQARLLLLDHVGGELDSEVLRSPRIVLIAGRFPKEVTHTAVWLSERDLDIRLVQLSAWTLGEQVLVGFGQIWPVPGLDTFTLGPARTDSAAIAEKVAQRNRAGTAIRRLVDAGTLPVGEQLTITPQHGVTNAQREVINAWLDADPARRQVTWTNDAAAPLTWAAEGGTWLPTSLARHLCAQATGDSISAVRGPTWFVTSDGRSLADLADGAASASGRDWADLHAVLDALPAGAWTTYGDLAQLIGTSAQPLAGHLSACTRCANAYRVLSSDGKVSPGFRWLDPERTDTPQELLEAEGVSFAGGIASATKRLSPQQLASLRSEGTADAVAVSAPLEGLVAPTLSE